MNAYVTKFLGKAMNIIRFHSLYLLLIHTKLFWAMDICSLQIIASY